MNIIQSFIGYKRGVIALVAFFVFCWMPLSAGDTQDQNLKQTAELKNSKITPPSAFKKEYKLEKLPLNGAPSGSAVKTRALKRLSSGKTTRLSAEVAVNILGPNFKPVKAYVLRDVTDTDNAATLWDGRDSYGRELPGGEYYAQLSILYSDGKQETKTFKFEKK